MTRRPSITPPPPPPGQRDISGLMIFCRTKAGQLVKLDKVKLQVKVNIQENVFGKQDLSFSVMMTLSVTDLHIIH